MRVKLSFKQVLNPFNMSLTSKSIELQERFGLKTCQLKDAISKRKQYSLKNVTKYQQDKPHKSNKNSLICSGDMVLIFKKNQQNRIPIHKKSNSNVTIGSEHSILEQFNQNTLCNISLQNPQKIIKHKQRIISSANNLINQQHSNIKRIKYPKHKLNYQSIDKKSLQIISHSMIKPNANIKTEVQIKLKNQKDRNKLSKSRALELYSRVFKKEDIERITIRKTLAEQSLDFYAKKLVLEERKDNKQSHQNKIKARYKNQAGFKWKKIRNSKQIQNISKLDDNFQLVGWQGF